jgi:hypothetical protein
MPTANALLSAGLALLAGAPLAAQDHSVARDANGYWTHTSTGTAAAPVLPRLRVVSRGRIVLRGGAGDQITFKLRQQVRARSQDHARALIGAVVPSARVYAGWTTFTVMPNSSPNAITVLELNVPRRLLEAALESQLGGGIEAYDIDGSVQAVTRAGEIRLDRIAGNVLGRTGGGEIRLGRIGGAVNCFSGGGSVHLESSGREANCATAGGDIVVGDAGGPLVVNTDGGNIRVTRASSTVQAHSREGVIEVLHAAGIVRADTRGGSIQVDSAHGVMAESAAGRVRVKSAAGPMNVSAASGSILAELFSGGRLEDSSLVAGSGDITVLIPSNLAVTVMARTDSAGALRLVSDFPEIRVGPAGLFRPPAFVQGALNGGGPLLHLNASGGVIYLKKVEGRR